MPARLKHIKDVYAMIVEDDVDERMVTMLCLQHEGVMAIGCSNGLEALLFLIEAEKEHKLPLCIFLDLNMPIMTGWELMSILKMMRDPMFKIPIIITTGEAIPDNKDYVVLHKPYTIEKLLEKIHALKKEVT